MLRGSSCSAREYAKMIMKANAPPVCLLLRLTTHYHNPDEEVIELHDSMLMGRNPTAMQHFGQLYGYGSLVNFGVHPSPQPPYRTSPSHCTDVLSLRSLLALWVLSCLLPLTHEGGAALPHFVVRNGISTQLALGFFIITTWLCMLALWALALSHRHSIEPKSSNMHPKHETRYIK